MIELNSQQITKISGAELMSYFTPECIALLDCKNEIYWNDWKCKFQFIPCDSSIVLKVY